MRSNMGVRLILFIVFFWTGGLLLAQDGSVIKLKDDSHYQFMLVKEVESTPVQDQFRTGTCWSFSTLGFFESELIRLNKGTYNLSEMYVVNHTYKEKADRYVRMHGKTNFGSGGAFVDIAYIWKKYGIVPENVYSGLQYGSDEHNHAELDNILTSYVDAVIENKQKNLSTKWKTGFDAVVDSYLGKLPETFTYEGKEYTPITFAEDLGLTMDDYISITSYTHHDFYKKFVLEIPDNWLHVESFNLPLDEMMAIIDAALMSGYSVAWGADVSEKGFAFREGLALLPQDENTIEVKGKDNANFSDAGAEKVSNAFIEPVPQMNVSQSMRQKQFDNWETTDDHAMQITGIVKDQNGDRYYIVKNSWGTDYNNLEGYFFASEAYVRLKTMNIYLHREALPKDLSKKLNL